MDGSIVLLWVAFFKVRRWEVKDGRRFSKQSIVSCSSQDQRGLGSDSGKFFVRIRNRHLTIFENTMNFATAPIHADEPTRTVPSEVSTFIKDQTASHKVRGMRVMASFQF